MTSVLDLLDRHPGDGVGTLGTPWWNEVEASLTAESTAWVAESGALDADRSWVLLAWAEVAASVVARERRDEVLAAAAQAVALLEGGPLDRRDVMVVGGLLHRAADLARLDFAAGVLRGCRRAGEKGTACATWLARIGAFDSNRPLQTATLLVTRTIATDPNSYDRHEAVVKLDGAEIGRLRQGDSLEVAVRPGDHEVRVRLRYNPNRAAIRVRAGESGTVEVECAKNATARNAFPPSRYWRLTVLSGRTSPPRRA